MRSQQIDIFNQIKYPSLTMGRKCKSDRLKSFDYNDQLQYLTNFKQKRRTTKMIQSIKTFGKTIKQNFQRYIPTALIILPVIANISFSLIAQIYGIDQSLNNITPYFSYIGYTFRFIGEMCEKINKQFANNEYKRLQQIAIVLKFCQKLHMEFGYILVALSNEEVQVVRASMGLAIMNLIVMITELYQFLISLQNNELHALQQVQARNGDDIQPHQNVHLV